MKNTFVAVVALIAIAMSSIGAMAAELPPELAEAASHGRLISLTSWNPDINSDVSLSCAVVLPAKQQDQTQGVLLIYQGAKRIFSFNSDASPLSIFPMGEGGNLATLWEGGDGTYVLDVFAFKAGKVEKVLEGSSKLMPEFVYAPSPPGSLTVDSKQAVPGGYWSQRIIIAKMDWVKNAKTGADEYLPLSADIYAWDGKQYQVRKNVKWTDRLK